jgi:hypothetical protein
MALRVLFVGVVTFCSGIFPVLGPADDAPQPVVLIVRTAGGNVRVKHPDWLGSLPAFPGMMLLPADILTGDTDSSVDVVCADINLYTVHLDRQRRIPLTCSASEQLMEYQHHPVMAMRGGGAGAYPMVLSPRRSKLLSPRPRLIWTKVPGASRYDLSLRSGRDEWTFQTASTSIDFPSAWPNLSAGRSYHLIVKTGQNSSEAEGASHVGFELLDADSADQVRTVQLKIRSLAAAPDDVKTLLIAYLFQAKGLNAEGTAFLEQLSNRSPREALLLGEFYVCSRLLRQAEAAFKEAAQSAQQEGDIGTAAEALHREITVMSAQGESQSEAIQRLKLLAENLAPPSWFSSSD